MSKILSESTNLKMSPRTQKERTKDGNEMVVTTREKQRVVRLRISVSEENPKH